MRLTTAIIIGFIISPLISIGLVIAGMKGIAVLSTNHHAAASGAADAAEIGQIAQDGNRLYRILADTVISRNLAIADKPWTELKATITADLERVDVLISDDGDPNDEGHVNAAAARKAYSEFVTIYEKEIVTMVKIDAEASDLRPIAEKLAGIRDEFMKALTNVSEVHIHQSDEATKKYESSEALIMRAGWYAAAIAVAINIVIAWLVSRKARFELSTKVGKVLSATAAAESGDLTAKVGLNGSDASDKVGQALERFLEKLRLNIVTISAASKQVDHSATTMVTTGNSLAKAAEVAAHQSSGAASSATQVSQSAQSVAAALEEMGVSIQEISRSSQEAASVAREAMNAAAQAISVAEQLGKSSTEIGAVVNAVSAIAEQTNLLALNATIEAARAGEAGRGFAVVAGEVKSLAAQTQKATGDIGARIATLQSDSSKVADAIKNIADVSGKIEALQASIAAAVEEQSATTKEATRSMTDVAKGSQSIADSIATVAETAQNTMTDASAVQASATELGGIAQELNRSISAYRLS